jgi:hypothetical protein
MRHGFLTVPPTLTDGLQSSPMPAIPHEQCQITPSPEVKARHFRVSAPYSRPVKFLVTYRKCLSV